MSQSSILVEDGRNGSHNPHEDSVRGCETEAEDPELVRPFSYHEAKITTRIVMNRNPKQRTLNWYVLSLTTKRR